MEALQMRSTEQLKEEILLTSILKDMLPTLSEQIRMRNLLIRRIVPDEQGRQPVSELLGQKTALNTNGNKTPSAPKKKKKPKKEITGEESAKLGSVAEKTEEAPTIPSVPVKEEEKPKGGPKPAPKAYLRSTTLKPISRPSLLRHVERILVEMNLRKTAIKCFLLHSF